MLFVSATGALPSSLPRRKLLEDPLPDRSTQRATQGPANVAPTVPAILAIALRRTAARASPERVLWIHQGTFTWCGIFISRPQFGSYTTACYNRCPSGLLRVKELVTLQLNFTLFARCRLFWRWFIYVYGKSPDVFVPSV